MCYQPPRTDICITFKFSGTLQSRSSTFPYRGKAATVPIPHIFLTRLPSLETRTSWRHIQDLQTRVFSNAPARRRPCAAAPSTPSGDGLISRSWFRDVVDDGTHGGKAAPIKVGESLRRCGRSDRRSPPWVRPMVR